jgi:hypothetical protein
MIGKTTFKNAGGCKASLAANVFHVRHESSGTAVSGEHRAALNQDAVLEQGVLRFNLAAGWDWNGATLNAFTDLYGFIPVFYYSTADELIVSDSLIQIIRRRAHTPLDPDALAVFFRVGFFIGEATPFNGVRVLPPAGRLTWSLGAPALVSGGITHPPAVPMSRADAAATYGGLFRIAIERRRGVGDRVVVPLSGGRDSRHILLALHAAGERPSLLVTVSATRPQRMEDPLIASALAAPTRPRLKEQKTGSPIFAPTSTPGVSRLPTLSAMLRPRCGMGSLVTCCLTVFFSQMKS